MRKNLLKFGLLCGIILLNLSCVFSISSFQKRYGGGMSREDEDLVNSPITLYEKYNQSAIPYIISRLANAKILDKQLPESRTAKHLQKLKAYADLLTKNTAVSADKLTIYDQKYWEAYFALFLDNPSVLFSRIFYLIRDGYLSKAQYVLIFAVMEASKQSQADYNLIQQLFKDMDLIYTAHLKYLSSGIKLHDAGNYEEAIAEYRKALQIYPKSPYALYEIGLSRIVSTYGQNPTNSDPGDEYFKLARNFDPFYLYAYQGKTTDESKLARKIIPQLIEPALTQIFKGEMSSDAFADLAEGCVQMGQWELALYAYKILLFYTYNNSFDRKIVKKMQYCLDKLGVSGAGTYLLDVLELYETLATDDTTI